MSDRIREYWSRRAAESAGQATATTNDVWLRELEISTLERAIREIAPHAKTLLDAGCGDGHSTICLAERLPGLRLRGLDFSPQMTTLAAARLAARSDLASRVEFRSGDVTDLSSSCGQDTYDIAVTDRCLINLESLERQQAAFNQIGAHLVPGGVFLAIENFHEGQERMNEARRALGLPEIGVRWHNRFFTEEEFERLARPLFELVAIRDFASTYYLATRVVYSKLCQLGGVEPDYNHEIHRLSVALPPAGRFSPVRLAVLRRRMSDG